MKDKVEFKRKNVVGAFMNIPIFVGNFSVMTDFAVMENMDAYRDEEMGDIIVGRPFCREACVKARRFDGIITIYKGNDSVSYQMARSHLWFKHLNNAQCNKMRPLMKVSTQDELKGLNTAFLYVSSSSPSPRKRRRVSPHSSSSVSLSSLSSIGPSRKRCSSSGTSLEDSSIEVSTRVGHEADIEAGIEVGAEASVWATIEIAFDVMAEPDTPPVLPEQTLTKRLDDHKEVIQEMYDHLLEMPLQMMKEVEEETRILTSRLETAEAERTNLRERVRALELSEKRLRDTLRVKRDRFVRVQHHLAYVSEELRHSRMSHFADRESLRRIETFMISYKRIITHSYLVMLFTQIDVDTTMPPRMRTQSAGRPAAESLGGGMGVRVGRGGKGRRPREGNVERVDDLNGQGNDQDIGANGAGGGV
ncbi:hypothetical protein Tco_0237449 [Tanacetum coccineum]